jgi:hypothetical protein
VAVSGFYNANPTGKAVWRDRVVPRTLKRKRLQQPIDEIRDSFKRIALLTPSGIHEAAAFDLQQAPIERVVRKITLGMLALLYPEIDRSLLSFQMLLVDQFKLNNPAFDLMQRHLPCFHRGDGVYRCWHGVEDHYSLKGMWVHMFYGAATFMVAQRSDRLIELPW